jgi:hypothetical protein
MKKILFLSFCLMLFFVVCCPKIHAQTEEQKITVKTSDLTADQLAKIMLEQKNAELQKKIETYGKWVGVGGEVGTAIKEGLNAVVDVSDKFSKTDVGKFTMIMIAWKVIGKDILSIIIGLLFFIVMTCVLIFSFKRTCIPHKVCIKNPGFLKYPKEYEYIEPKLKVGDGLYAYGFLHLALFMGLIGITYAIMF